VSPLREQPRDRQAFAGTQARERPILELGPAGPMKGRVSVVPIRLRSRWAEVVFSVEVEWTGPGLPELPPSPTPVVARDVYSVRDQELARAIAMAALDELRGGRVPSLRELADRFA
jgi:hypothetical protein